MGLVSYTNSSIVIPLKFSKRMVQSIPCLQTTYDVKVEWGLKS